MPTLEKLNAACKKWLDEAMVPSIKESHVDVEAAAKAAAGREAALATQEEPAEEAAVVDLAQKAGTSLTAPAAATGRHSGRPPPKGTVLWAKMEGQCTPRS